MKFLLPLLLVGFTIPTWADMVLPDGFENSRRFQSLDQFAIAQDFRGFYANPQGSPIAIFQLVNNPGLGIGLFKRDEGGNWVPELFPNGRGPSENAGPFGQPETEWEPSGSAILTPEPSTVVGLSAAVGILLLMRRRKRM